MIAITFALPAESSDLLRNCLPERTTTKAGKRKIFLGRILGRDVAIFHTGVGRDVAEKSTNEFLSVIQPKVLISSGFAGAVRSTLTVGAAVIGTNFSHPGLIEKLVPRPTTKLFTAPAIIDSVEERTRIASENDADAVDMETEVIARVCANRGIRMLSLRVVSDTLTEPFPLPPSKLFIVQRQRINFAGIVDCLVREPRAIARLVRFSRQISRARRAVQNNILWALAEFENEPLKTYLGL